MRQGGFKPKSHSSGQYWIRANAETGKRKKKKVNKEKIAIDTDGDGIADTYGYEVDEDIEEETFNSSSIIDFIVVTIAVIAWFIFLFSLALSGVKLH